MRIFKRILASAAAIALAVGGVLGAGDSSFSQQLGFEGAVTAYAADMSGISASVTEGTNTSNELSSYYSRWTSPAASYIQSNSDGTLSKITADNGSVFIDTYTSDYKHISTDEIQSELPIWGGYYCGSEYNFCLFGQNNPTEDDALEVIRLVKYTKNWEPVAGIGFYNVNTTVPFDAGTPRMYEDSGNLYIHTSHEMYKSSDGYNHQANFQIHVDIDTMSTFYAYYDVMNIQQKGYVSHSFDQYIRAEGDYVYTVDLGDASPRCVALSKKASSGDMIGYTSALDIAGERGNNTTGVSLGGFELSDNSCIIAGNSMIQDGSAENTNVRNIFVSITDKALSETNVMWLTDFSEAYMVSVPKLVKLDGKTFVAMWNEYNDTYGNCMHAVKFTEDGTVLEEVTLGAPVSQCDPIVVGNEIVWCLSDGNTTTFYHLEYGNLSQYQGLEPDVQPPADNGETYWTFQSYEDYAEIYMCETTESRIEIPSIHNGLPVKVITYAAFANCTSIEELIIPDTVTTIEYIAFGGCSSLKEITIPASVDTIEEGAFYGCVSLDSITIENPDCDIYDYSYNGYYEMFSSDTVIRGYSGSTAEAFAEKFGYEFESIDGENSEPVFGDADLDGRVSISDVVLIMSHASNKEKTPLSNEALDNSDVYQRGDGVSVSDALSVQKFLAQVILELPEL